MHSTTNIVNHMASFAHTRWNIKWKDSEAHLVLLGNCKGLSKGGRAGVCSRVVACRVRARGLLKGRVGGGCGARGEWTCVVQAVLPAVHRWGLRTHRRGLEEGGRKIALLHWDRDELVLRCIQPVTEECLQFTL